MLLNKTVKVVVKRAVKYMQAKEDTFLRAKI